MSVEGPKNTVNAMHQVMHEVRDYQQIEVITGRRRHRNWTDDERARIVAESAGPGANISEVARRWGAHRGLLSGWRREAGVSGCAPSRKTAAPPQGPPRFVPITLAAPTAPLTLAARRLQEPDSAACGRIEFEICRLIMTGPVNPVVMTALVAALCASGSCRQVA